MTNRELYGNLPRADDIIRHRRLHFAGHAARRSAGRYQPVADLVFWQGPEGHSSRQFYRMDVLIGHDVHFTVDRHIQLCFHGVNTRVLVC